MTNLGTSTDEQPTDGFATIPDTSILALSNSVTSSQTVFGLTKGDVFKIMKVDTINIVPVRGSTQNSVNHGLSGIPTVIAFLQAGGNYYPLPFDTTSYNSGTDTITTDCHIDILATSVVVSFRVVCTADGLANIGSPITIKYYFLQEARN